MGKISDPMLFSPRDFWGDENVRMMSPEQVYAYLKLLSYQWEEGSIPDSPERVAAILSEGCRSFTAEDVAGPQAELKPSLSSAQAGLWLGLSSCYEVRENDGRLVNPRCEKDRLAWEKKRQSYRDRGKKGGRKRVSNLKKPKAPSDLPQAELKPSLSSAQAGLKLDSSQAQALSVSVSPSVSVSGSVSESDQDISAPPPQAPRKRGADSPKSPYPPDFSRAYDAWNRKGSKGDALKAWTQTKKLRPDTDAVVAKIEQMQTQHDQWIRDGGEYQPLMATWLRAHGWEDEPIRNGSGRGRQQPTMDPEDLAYLEDCIRRQEEDTSEPR